MSRNRIAMVVGVLALFVLVGGILIYAGDRGGGQNVTFGVTVSAAGKMSPSRLSAHQNDTITINLSSDTDGEVHLHGYDIVFAAKAGQVVSRTFKADKTCGCDIEWESTGAPLGSLTVSP